MLSYSSFFALYIFISLNRESLWNLPSNGEKADLFAVKLKAKETISANEIGNYIQLNNQEFKNQFFEGDGEIAIIDLRCRQKEESKFQLKNFFPNPTQNTTNFVIDLESTDAQVSIVVSDLNGNQVASFTTYSNPSGEVTIPMDLSTLNNGALFAQIAIGQKPAFVENLIKVN